MTLNRRQLLTGVAGGLLGEVVLPRVCTARQAETVLTNAVVALTDRLFLVTAARPGPNVLALSTPEGLVLVDSAAPPSSAVLMSLLRRLPAGEQFRTLFNTHWHLENTAGNEILRQAGATIVAHENTRLWMATPTWMPKEDRYRPPRPKGAHPTETFYGDATMTAGGERIDYGYLIEAHTSGDIYVFFRDSNVLAVGDVASPTLDPSLDYFTGAWIGGRLDALDRLVKMAKDDTRIVPGFGPVMTRAELTAERDMMKAVYDRTVDRVREGDSVEDMLEAGVLKGLRPLKDPTTFIHDVHKGLWAHHNKLNANVV